MIPVEINNRPFATDLLTGLMVPDGIFESSIGQMMLNAHFTNSSSSNLNSVRIYVETASHPNIAITPVTHSVGSFGGGASILKSWDLNIANVPAGTYYVSFIVENSSESHRIIKKIFITNTSFDSINKVFTTQTPEGSYTIRYREITEPISTKCCKDKKSPSKMKDLGDALENLGYTFTIGERMVELCPISFLPLEYETGWTPNPVYLGQHSDLPFQDPWWKVLIAIAAFLLLVAAAIVEATSGSGSVSGTLGCTTTPSGVCASGSGSSPIAAGLVAAAAVVAGIAAYSDERDLHRIGQDKTPPKNGEMTHSESLNASFKYIDPIEFGKPFKVGVDWEYLRTVKDVNGIEKTYSYSDTTVNENVHLLSRYEINAPDIVRIYKKQPFLIKASFFDQNDTLLKGSQLFVKCFLIQEETNRQIDFILEDNGERADNSGNDGVYTGLRYFSKNESGRWKYLVIAQDVNYAKEGIEPEEAAQIIGGMVLTNQLSISFDGGSCPLVPDGDVEVIA
ncbi:hypothetical protein [Ulvibacterium sp.]|uniref:hypothetical protein n=1 Tax=Ulvibacterium sp. TaxID=2665914 RepID=UPI003CC644E4